MLAYVLPAIPFIRFLFGILGWILNVAIAVLAVTVFAAAHVTREDGNRLIVNATRQGWLFLPALILRPALMLLGLILGYFVFLGAVGLFNQVWLPQMRDAGASGGLGPVGFLAMLALYVIVAYGLPYSPSPSSASVPSTALLRRGMSSGRTRPLMRRNSPSSRMVAMHPEIARSASGNSARASSDALISSLRVSMASASSTSASVHSSSSRLVISSSRASRVDMM